MKRPSKASLREIPELDSRSASIRRGPKPGRTLVLSLRAMREAAGKTQVDLARALDTDQAEVSRLERRDDSRLSTLRKYAEALGAECEVTFVFGGGQRIILGDPE